MATRPTLEAGRAICFHFGPHWSGASYHGR